MSVTEESKTMMLAKGLLLRKLTLPGLASEKIDGVPGSYAAQGMLSRSMKPLPGARYIEDTICPLLPQNLYLVGEHHIQGKRFKYVSGKVRKGEPAEGLKLALFDCYIRSPSGVIEPIPFYERLQILEDFVATHSATLSSKLGGGVVHTIEHHCVENEADINDFVAKLEVLRKTRYVEGAIIQPRNSLYAIKRSWDLQRIVFKPTIDLKVEGFAEAVSLEGEPKGMIGAFWVTYAGNKVKVSAGRLTHYERTEIFENPVRFLGKIAKIQYKFDDSYDALREPVFIGWHEDKATPDTICDGKED